LGNRSISRNGSRLHVCFDHGANATHIKRWLCLQNSPCRKELVKNDYENLVKNIWGHVATGALVGIFALIMSVHQLISANHLPALLVFELALMVFAPIFTIDDLKVVIIATSSNMILVLYYVVFITPFKAEGLFFLPGIAVTLLILNMIIYSFWAFALSILERIFSKEFWKSATIGLRQTIQQ